MGYNVADIIGKVINIALRKRKIYETIGQEKCDSPSIKLFSNILIKQVDRSIELCEAMLKEINNAEEIDFSIYDKISSLMSDFNNRIDLAEINNVKEYLTYALVLEKSAYSLLLDIQGRSVKTTSDLHSKTYKILSDIIDNKAKYIAMLEKALG